MRAEYQIRADWATYGAGLTWERLLAKEKWILLLVLHDLIYVFIGCFTA